jgi:hypothetical protein
MDTVPMKKELQQGCTEQQLEGHRGNMQAEARPPTSKGRACPCCKHREMGTAIQALLQRAGKAEQGLVHCPKVQGAELRG